jgi:hypothetical protein
VCRTFNTPSQVVKHAQMHLDKHDRTWLPCTVPGCTQTYATQSAIKKHIATAHDPSQLRFRCGDLKLLQAVMPLPSPQRDQVLQCPAAFFTKATWVEHLKAKHDLEPTHPQLLEVVRIMRGLPQLPSIPHIVPPQFLAAMHMQQQAAAAVQGGSTQNRAANAVALAMQAAAAAGGPQGSPSGSLFLTAPGGAMPPMPLLPFPVGVAPPVLPAAAAAAGGAPASGAAPATTAPAPTVPAAPAAGGAVPPPVSLVAPPAAGVPVLPTLGSPVAPAGAPSS